MDTLPLNRLIHETSPYLIQHAQNPVDWYPWGDEAFEKAAIENKPIFLSIGYSTCHWCHVMAHESFEDEEVAQILNKYFISVKVDREERSDIDTVYMNVCQAMNGHGGWPLTILMTPDKKPFFAGTYFPKNGNLGQPGLIPLLRSVSKKWREDRENILLISENVIGAITTQASDIPDGLAGSKNPQTLVNDAYEHFNRSFDKTYGGFGTAPKFPSPHNLMFLLSFAGYCKEEDKKQRAWFMAEKTLDGMYLGGLFDHAGFGFSRYSTDKKWLAPHFEKMLYDNALLVMTYCDAYAISGKEIYRYAAEKTLEYILREMTHPEGGFYSAQDADSEGEEGKYYTFSYKEIITLLGANDGIFLCPQYDITPEGNFEGKNILNKIENGSLNIPDKKTQSLLTALFNYRKERYILHKDDKILTAWNGLMIAAFAKAGRVFQNPAYIQAAEKAMKFVETRLTKEKGYLYISFRDNRRKGAGLLDDYAFLLWGNIALYETTFNGRYLEKALELTGIINREFPDEKGGYFLNPKGANELFYRPKELYDGAMPSGNSVIAYCLVKLARLTGDISLAKNAEKQLTFILNYLSDYPAACTFALKGLLLQIDKGKDLVCVVNDIREISGLCIDPDKISAHVITAENKKELINMVSFLADYAAHPQTPAYFLCENRSCRAPIYDLDELKKVLKHQS